MLPLMCLPVYPLFLNFPDWGDLNIRLGQQKNLKLLEERVTAKSQWEIAVIFGSERFPFFMCFPFPWWLILFSLLCFYVYTRLQEFKNFHVFISFKEVSVSNFCALPVTLFFSLCLSLTQGSWCPVSGLWWQTGSWFCPEGSLTFCQKFKSFSGGYWSSTFSKWLPSSLYGWLLKRYGCIFIFYLPTHRFWLPPPAYIVMLTDERPLH